jgi:hypothetical protein
MNKQELKLLIWKENWADEMDLEAFVITDKAGYEKWLAEGKDLRDFEISFGTNEYNEYGYFRELERNVSVKDITEAEYNVLASTLLLKESSYLSEKGITYASFGIDNFFAQVIQRYEDDGDWFIR